jgi:hypothetical protein
MQYALGITPELRTNVDYCFILKEPIQANRKKLYEQYAGVFPSFSVFNQAMDQCTEDFGMIVIDNTKSSTKLEDMAYWYKAKDPGDFKLGNDQYWRFSDKNFDKDHKKNQVKRHSHTGVHIQQVGRKKMN